MTEVKNRNPIKQWSVTFPQCGDFEREAFIDAFPPNDEAFCAREEHKEGGYHLHMGIKLKKGISHANMVKWVQQRFPNDWKRIEFKPTRSMKAWKDYCSKEDASMLKKGKSEIDGKCLDMYKQILEWGADAKIPEDTFWCRTCKRYWPTKLRWTGMMCCKCAENDRWFWTPGMLLADKLSKVEF